MILVLSVLCFLCLCPPGSYVRINHESYKIMKHLLFHQRSSSSEGNMLGSKIYESVEPENQYEAKRVKRYRSAFTTGQINYLEKQFKKCPYIGNTARKEVANVLNIPERAIKIWFQNRRMKEKKESVNSEYNVDRQNSVTNNLEFTNNSLNNVHSSQSANDRQYSLQSVMSYYNKDNINLYHVGENDHNSKSIRFETLKQEISGLEKPYRIEDTKNLDIDRTVVEEQANLFKYNFNKVYSNMKFIKHLEKNNNEGMNKSKPTPKIRNKTEGRSKQSGSTRGYQDLPEDLSAQNNRIIGQKHTGNINMSHAYVPFCNSRNIFTPCVSAGNIIWKPVNVMPVITPNNLPVIVPESPPSGIPQNNTQNCNCDCHLKKSLNNDHTTNKPQAQYVIAIPYNNN